MTSKVFYVIQSSASDGFSYAIRSIKPIEPPTEYQDLWGLTHRVQRCAGYASEIGATSALRILNAKLLKENLAKDPNFLSRSVRAKKGLLRKICP